MAVWYDDYLVKNFAGALMGSDFTRMMLTPFVIPKVFISINMFPDKPGLTADSVDLVVQSIPCERKKLFIVTDEFSARFADRIVTAFEKRYQFQTRIWDGALPEVPLDSLEECVKSMNGFEPDVILALGGGSAMDAAKVAWLMYERPEMTDFESSCSPLFPLGIRKKAHMVAVPTTSGTGSECSPTSVVTDTKAHRKIPVVHPELIPDIALIDPTLPSRMPPQLTAGTGLDALAHSVDAVLCPAAFDLTDAIALRAIRMVFKYLPRAYRDGKDREARYRMHLASTMAGMVLSQAGSGVSHAMGHALGANFDLHHGLCVGLLTPYAMQGYYFVTDKYLDICDELNVRAKSNEKSFFNLVAKLRGFMKEIDCPDTIKGLGIGKKDFDVKLDVLCEQAANDVTNIVPAANTLTADQIKKLYRIAYSGKNLDLNADF